MARIASSPASVMISAMAIDEYRGDHGSEEIMA
jgi:hypothetical protein